MDMGGSATSTAAMASSTSDMGGHNMGDMTMSMADMAMTFFTSSTTPLFSDDWTPSNLGQYAGTCIFLIILASILRFLLALRPLLEVRFWRKTAAATAVIKEEEQDGEDRLLNARPGQALTALRRDVGRRWSGWRVDTAAWRATYELLIAAAGYLL